jgi:hypothetical protein
MTDMLCLLGLLGIVGVRCERRDADVHPAAEWECFEKPVQFGSVIGAVETDGLPLTGSGRRPPKPLEMSLASQRRRGGALRADALFNLGVGCPVWNGELELDQEFHDSSFELEPVVL